MSGHFMRQIWNPNLFTTVLDDVAQNGVTALTGSVLTANLDKVFFSTVSNGYSQLFTIPWCNWKWTTKSDYIVWYLDIIRGNYLQGLKWGSFNQFPVIFFSIIAKIHLVIKATIIVVKSLIWVILSNLTILCWWSYKWFASKCKDWPARESIYYIPLGMLLSLSCCVH